MKTTKNTKRATAAPTTAAPTAPTAPTTPTPTAPTPQTAQTCTVGAAATPYTAAATRPVRVIRAQGATPLVSHSHPEAAADTLRHVVAKLDTANAPAAITDPIALASLRDAKARADAGRTAYAETFRRVEATLVASNPDLRALRAAVDEAQSQLRCAAETCRRFPDEAAAIAKLDNADRHCREVQAEYVKSLRDLGIYDSRDVAASHRRWAKATKKYLKLLRNAQSGAVCDVKRRLDADLPTLLAATCVASSDDAKIAASAAVSNAAVKRMNRRGFTRTCEADTYGVSLADATARNTATGEAFKRTPEHRKTAHIDAKGELPARDRETGMLADAYIAIRELGATLPHGGKVAEDWTAECLIRGSDGKSRRGRPISAVIGRVADKASYAWGRSLDSVLVMLSAEGGDDEVGSPYDRAADRYSYCSYMNSENSGEKWMSGEEQERIVKCMRRELKNAPFTVFEYLASGYKQSEIADLLGRRKSTISTHASKVSKAGEDAIREVLPKARAEALINAQKSKK